MGCRALGILMISMATYICPNTRSPKSPQYNIRPNRAPLKKWSFAFSFLQKTSFSTLCDKLHMLGVWRSRSPIQKHPILLAKLSIVPTSCISVSRGCSPIPIPRCADQMPDAFHGCKFRFALYVSEVWGSVEVEEQWKPNKSAS